MASMTKHTIRKPRWMLATCVLVLALSALVAASPRPQEYSAAQPAPPQPAPAGNGYPVQQTTSSTSTSQTPTPTAPKQEAAQQQQPTNTNPCPCAGAPGGGANGQTFTGNGVVNGNIGGQQISLNASGVVNAINGLRGKQQQGACPCAPSQVGQPGATGTQVVDQQPPQGQQQRPRFIGNCEQSGRRVRREIRDHSREEMQQIVTAFQRIQQSGRFEAIVRKYNAEYSTMVATPHFYPWRRACIRELEFEMLAETKGMGLPYWAMTRDASRPMDSELFTDQFFGAANGCMGGVFKDFKGPNGQCLQQNVQNGAWIVEPTLAMLTSACRTSFASFSAMLQTSLHVQVLNGCGGAFAQRETAAFHPMFWLMAAGEDFYMTRFQQQSTETRLLFDGQFQGRAVQLTDQIAGCQARELLDTSNLCYEYAEPRRAAAGNNTSTTPPTQPPTQQPTRPPTQPPQNSNTTPPTNNGTAQQQPDECREQQAGSQIGYGGVTIIIEAGKKQAQIPDCAPIPPAFVKQCGYQQADIETNYKRISLAQTYCAKFLQADEQLPTFTNFQNISSGQLKAFEADLQSQAPLPGPRFGSDAARAATGTASAMALAVAAAVAMVLA